LKREKKEKYVVLYDMKGFSWPKNFDGAGMAKLGTLQGYYPELLETCYMVNVTSMFEIFWSILKMMGSKKTLQKVSFVFLLDPPTATLTLSFTSYPPPTSR